MANFKPVWQVLRSMWFEIHWCISSFGHLISLQPRSFSASWSTWHGYLWSSEVERREAGEAELKVMQEAFRPLLWASTTGNSTGSLGAGLQLAEATRWKTTTYQEAPTWQTGAGEGAKLWGNESISAFCFSSKSLPPLQAWAALAGLSTMTFCFGSIIMVVSGCQVCGLFVLFVFGGGNYLLSEWDLLGYGDSGAPRQLHWRGSLPESSPISGCPPLPSLLCWMFSPVDVYSSPGQVPPVTWVLTIVCLWGKQYSDWNIPVTILKTKTRTTKPFKPLRQF